MTLADLIRRFRVLADDAVDDVKWKREDVIDWLNDAQAQACVRGRLLVAEGDPELCEIALTADESVYPLHRKLYEIIDLRIEGLDHASRTVALKTREWLNAERPDWRKESRPACIAIQTDTGLRLVGAVDTGELLVIEAYRLPLKDLVNHGDRPEIHEAHHEHLIQWALHKAFSVPDSEMFDPERSILAERAFTAYFGPLPDSGMRRETRQDVQHFNRAVLP